MQQVKDALGDFLADFLGTMSEIGTPSSTPSRHVYSVRELRIKQAVLNHWRHGCTCTVTQLARETGTSKTTVSRAISRLMAEGLLKDEPDAEDGRRRLLLPTEDGLRVLEHVEARLGLWADRLQALVVRRETSIIVPEPVTPPRHLFRDSASS
jgi:DNA-binding MarR family transcriptional regulator